MPPKVSIVMSVYNMAQFLPEAIESWLRQSFTDFEFLIADDCSTDETPTIIQQYALQDQRICYIKNETNLTIPVSVNKLIDMAKGRYIARADGDDNARPDRLEKQVQLLDENPDIAICFGKTQYIDINSQAICPGDQPRSLNKIMKWLPYINYIPQPTVTGRTTVFRQFPYNSACRRSSDCELWIRMRDAGVQFQKIDSILTDYRINPKGITQTANTHLNNYWEHLASLCVWNGHPRAALKYCPKLSLKDKLKLSLKILFPKALFIYILLQKQKYKYRKAKSLIDGKTGNP